MRLRMIVLGLLVLAGVAAPAAADQTHPRLDVLFERLQETESATQGREITSRIWKLWRQTDDEVVAEAMERGAQALAVNDHERAVTIYSRVIERAPDYAEGWNKRATARYLLERYAAAAADIRRTLSLEPRHFGALAGLGLVYSEIGQPRAAIDAFERALEINPHLEGTRRNLEMVRERLQGEGA